MHRMKNSIARVACGHRETTKAAASVLRHGGNAVDALDALIAAAWTACVAEPVLCSPGGGGHALLRMRGRAPVVADFFTQTPRARRLKDLDFYPIQGNFGSEVQEFHIRKSRSFTSASPRPQCPAWLPDCSQCISVTQRCPCPNS